MKKKGLWEENWRSVTNGVLEMYVVWMAMKNADTFKGSAEFEFLLRNSSKFKFYSRDPFTCHH
jgi:hypothetical protein